MIRKLKDMFWADRLIKFLKEQEGQYNAADLRLSELQIYLALSYVRLFRLAITRKSQYICFPSAIHSYLYNHL
jgi:hypothetical protein